MRLFRYVTTNIRPLLWFFVGLLSFTSIANVPDLEANKDERSLSNPSYIIGQHWFRKLNGSRALIDFPPAYDYFKETLAKLLPQTNLYNKTVEMTFLNSSQSNAFVIPGNHMFLYSDMMETVSDESMLLGLMSHELAHLDLRHYERQKQFKNTEYKKTLTLIGASIAAALAGADTDTTTALWLGSIANQAQNSLSYSRNQEKEADRQGRQYLINAGLPTEGVSALFTAFLKKALGRPKIEFLSTHPSPNTRLSDSFTAEKRETILNSQPNNDFHYFRSSLLAYRAGLVSQPYQYLEQQIQHEDAKNFAKGLLSYLIQAPERTIQFLNKIQQHNRFTHYLYALSYLSIGENKKSIDSIQKELEINPNNIVFSTLKSEIENTKPKDVKTEYLYEKRLLWRANIQYYKKSNNIPLALNYHALLIFHQGKNKEANNLIKRASRHKNIEIKNTENFFKKIKEAEIQEKIEE